MATHRESELLLQKCEICSKILSKSGIREHMIRAHDTSKFPCAICSKEYNHPDDMKKHLKFHDSNRKSLHL